MTDHRKPKSRSFQRVSALVGLTAGAVVTGGSGIAAQPSSAPSAAVAPIALSARPSSDAVAEYLDMRDSYRAAHVTRSRVERLVKDEARDVAKQEAATEAPQTVTPRSVAGSSAPKTVTRRVQPRRGSKPAVTAPVTIERTTYSRAHVIAIAARLKGVRYRAGGTSPAVGFDCSGYTAYVFGRMGIALPHSSDGQYGLATKISKAEAKPGDLVFWHGRGGVYHVAIYAGGGKVWHSPFPGKRVQKVAIWGGRVTYGRLPQSLLS